MKYDPKKGLRNIRLSRQDKKFLTMMGLAFGLLALVAILDTLGVI